MMPMFDVPVPSSGWMLPETGPLTWFVTQIGTPPPEIGSGAPKKNSHVPVPHAASSVHLTSVELEHRWLSTIVVLAIGPLIGQSPHSPSVSPGQSTEKLNDPP